MKSFFVWCHINEEDINWCGTTAGSMTWVVFGIVLGMGLLVFLLYMPDNIIDILKVVMSGFIAFSVAIAAQQFSHNRRQSELNNKWNRKQLAVTQMHASRKIMKEAIKELHGHFEILEQQEAYSLHEIHDAMGARLKNGEFIFHNENTDDDIKLLPTKQDETEKFRAVKFQEINGRDIKDNILNYLGEFEYICSAINNEIFDDDTVKSLLRKNIIRAYTIFEKYILHLQAIHGDKNTYSELQKVACRYMNEA